MLRFALGRRIGRFGAQVPRRIDLDFTGGALPSRATLTRASTGSRFNSLGVHVIEATDATRFDYDGATLTLRGLLVEPLRTNLPPYSAALDNAAWSVTGAAIGADAAVAPDGSTAAESFTPGTGAGTRQVYQTITPPLSSAVSIFGKAVNGRYLTISLGVSAAYAAATFDLVAGVVTQSSGPGWTGVSAAMRSVGNGWCRCTLRALGPGTSSFVIFSYSDVPTFTSSGFGRNNSAVGTGTVAYHLWGAQLESFDTGVTGATSYIPTAASAVARAADVLTVAVPSGTYNRTTRCGTVLTAGTDYADTITVAGGSYGFAMPTAALAAGERHVRSIALERIR